MKDETENLILLKAMGEFINTPTVADFNIMRVKLAVGSGKKLASDFVSLFPDYDNLTLHDLVKSIQTYVSFYKKFVSDVNALENPVNEIVARAGYTPDLAIDFKASGGGLRLDVVRDLRGLADFLEISEDDYLMNGNDQFETPTVAASFSREVQ